MNLIGFIDTQVNLLSSRSPSPFHRVLLGSSVRVCVCVCVRVSIELLPFSRSLRLLLQYSASIFHFALILFNNLQFAFSLSFFRAAFFPILSAALCRVHSLEMIPQTNECVRVGVHSIFCRFAGAAAAADVVAGAGSSSSSHFQYTFFSLFHFLQFIFRLFLINGNAFDVIVNSFHIYCELLWSRSLAGWRVIRSYAHAKECATAKCRLPTVGRASEITFLEMVFLVFSHFCISISRRNRIAASALSANSFFCWNFLSLLETCCSQQ